MAWGRGYMWTKITSIMFKCSWAPAQNTTVTCLSKRVSGQALGTHDQQTKEGERGLQRKQKMIDKATSDYQDLNLGILLYVHGQYGNL